MDSLIWWYSLISVLKEKLKSKTVETEDGQDGPLQLIPVETIFGNYGEVIFMFFPGI